MTYRRERDIPRLIGICEAELADDLMSRASLVAKLNRFLVTESKRGSEGHWAYCQTRHKGLIDAVKIEQEALDRLWQEQHAL